MFKYSFAEPIEIDHKSVRLLKEAAQVLRQHAVEANDYKSWELMRFVREVETVREAEVAESQFRKWVAKRLADEQSQILRHG